METVYSGFRLIVTVLAGIAGVQIARKLKIPAPFMTGAMAAVLLFGILTGKAYFPVAAKPVIQAVAGGAIGVNMTVKAVRGLKKVIAPAFAYVVALIIVATSAALFMTIVTDISPVTALLSCAPGGVVDMSLLSYDFAANTSQVTVLQMMRLMVGLGIFPSLTFACVRKYDKYGNVEKISVNTKVAVQEKATTRMVATTFFVLLAGCAVGVVSKIPAGALTIPMIFVAAYQIKTNQAVMPVNLRRGAQTAAGIMAGFSMTASDLKQISFLLIPAGIILAEFLFLNYCIGPLLSKLFHLDLMTALLACTPAGVTDMALIAGEMGGDQAKVAAFQLLRLTTSLAVFPLIAVFFKQFL